MSPTLSNQKVGATYTYAVDTGSSLPGGLILTAGTGMITGTPTTYSENEVKVRIKVTNSNDETDTDAYEITFPAVAKKANTVTFNSNALTQFYKDDTGVYYMSGSTRTAISAGAFPATAPGGTVTYTYSSNGTNYSDSLPGAVGTWTVKAGTVGDDTYGPAETNPLHHRYREGRGKHCCNYSAKSNCVCCGTDLGHHWHGSHRHL